jgi:hypothetical protein
MILAALVTMSLVGEAVELPRGCFSVREAGVKRVPHGYYIDYMNRFVHEANTTRSGDERYWICSIGGNKQIMLFVPKEEDDGD